MTGGNDKAITLLDNFWKDISNSYTFGPSSRFQDYLLNWNPFDNSWISSFFNRFTDYDFASSTYDPLKRILDDHLEFECLRKTSKIQIYVSATKVNSVNKPGVPKTSREILDRLNEVTFNSSLMREIRGIVNIQKLSEGQWCDPRNPYSHLRLHLIDNERFMAKLRESSKFNVTWDFLTDLKEKGRQTATLWLEKNFKHLGVRTSMDLTEWKLETPTTTCLNWDKDSN